MLFPAKMDTYIQILKDVHELFRTAVRDGGELSEMADKHAVTAGSLLTRNIPLSELMGKYDSIIKSLGSYLSSPSSFSSRRDLPSIKLFRSVLVFKNECDTLEKAAEYGIIGILAALLGEDVAYISPESDQPPSRYENWDIPDRIRMSWAIPTLKQRSMHLNDSSRGTELADFDAGGSDILSDPLITSDTGYVARMLYRRAVRKLFLSLFLCESAGYAATLLTGVGTPSSYYTTDDEDFLPNDVLDRMNKVLHYDPPTGYILKEEERQGGSLNDVFASYHAHAGILPALSDLTEAKPHQGSSLPFSVQNQFGAWYQDPDKAKEAQWALVITPQIARPVRDTSRIAIDFTIQHILAKTGALTPGTDAKHRWFRYYVRLDYSYSALLLDHLAIRGMVVENGAFSAYLTRFLISREEDGGPILASFMVFADRGFLTDHSEQLGSPAINIDGTKYSAEFTYISEWIPSGPGLRPGDQDIGDYPGTGLPAYDDYLGTESRFSPFAAYLVTIKEEA